jgi:hypothetical protein
MPTAKVAVKLKRSARVDELLSSKGVHIEVTIVVVRFHHAHSITVEYPAMMDALYQRLLHILVALPFPCRLQDDAKGILIDFQHAHINPFT